MLTWENHRELEPRRESESFVEWALRVITALLGEKMPEL